MKIIHTADWHLCDRLGRVDRTDDLRQRVELIARLCDEHAADVLLIAGDLFYEQASVEQMTAALTHLLRTFAPFFDRGGTILAITGNHDREGRIEMVRAGMLLAAPPAAGRELTPGRMYLLNRTYFGRLQTATGDKAQFVLVPYPTVSRYGDAADVYRSKDEENRLLQGRVAEWIKSVPEHPEFDRQLPTILAAHLHVRGAELHTLYKISECDDVVFDIGFLPTSWAYIALGHIHKPQCLSGMAHVRYPGSLDRLDFGEKADDKSVVLIDVGPSGLRGEPLLLPLPASPMHDLAIANAAAELPTLADRYPDRASALVRIVVKHAPSGPSRDEVERELRQLFPRYTDIRWTKPEGTSGTAGISPRADCRTTVRAFLASQLGNDPDRDAVLALAETFLSGEAIQ